MKILYGIQGTGNGHMSRANAILPRLSEYAEVDVLVSGHSSEITSAFPVKYQYPGLGFTFGKNGGINYWQSVLRSKPAAFWKSIRTLPVKEYDLVVTDFEPVSAWAAKLACVPCIGVSHQAAFLSDKSPRPADRQWFGELLFRSFAPVDTAIGFHYQPYDHHILTPVIRDEVRSLHPTDQGHITVYLPAYSPERLLPYLQQTGRPVHLFTKHEQQPRTSGMVEIYPVSSEAYLKSLEGCTALVCGAGFESPSEGLFLGKRMLCIPMKQQYEQHCNAAALEQIGVPVLHKVDAEFGIALQNMLALPAPEPVNYPDILTEVCDTLFSLYSNFEIVRKCAGKKPAAETKVLSMPAPDFREERSHTPGFAFSNQTAANG
ncbi:MAG: glycosyl transferase [Candidatus Cyclonatronum sp.]|uniref:glycosyltransferase family protein n=1 Tax=Cyclonatronum sp. TaxID=3024185 RepID=UPI0025B7E216|nr:glycosyltransferase family protein [Cyclonatronum sp.]MCH8487361.1 glycosyl transferase [Cyclonatronum sp.]